MKSVFISYDHDDQRYLNDIKSVRLNPNNRINFIDRSLKEPIYNTYGHVNRRLPSDSASADVRRGIEELLRNSSKLLVLLGRDTHSSEWVKWEIDTFRNIKNNPDILIMRVNGNDYAGTPRNANFLSVHNWNVNLLSDWLAR